MGPRSLRRNAKGIEKLAITNLNWAGNISKEGTGGLCCLVFSFWSQGQQTLGTAGESSKKKKLSFSPMIKWIDSQFFILYNNLYVGIRFELRL